MTFRFTLIILLFITNFVSGYSCDCVPEPAESIAEKVKQYDFIAIVMIKTVREFPFAKNVSFQNDYAQIEITELFKGDKTDSIYISGIGTSCDMGLKKGEEWLIFGKKNKDHYLTGRCTPSILNTSKDWKNDKPFFLTLSYLLKQHFNHPQTALKNGLYTTFFSDNKLKCRYFVDHNKPEGMFSYLTNNRTIAYKYFFKDGIIEGSAYELNSDSRSISIFKYKNGELKELIEYRIFDTLINTEEVFLADSINITQFKDKFISLHQLYLPDKSTILNLWYKSGSLYKTEQRDSTGKVLFALSYYESGVIESTNVLDSNTQLRELTRYNNKGDVIKKNISQQKNNPD